MVLHFSRAGTHYSDDYKTGIWMVAGKDGGLVQMAVNHPQEQNPLLPGWLKVQSGHPVPPPKLLIQRGIQVTTDKCKEQVFSADMSGLKVGNEDSNEAAQCVLVWDGKRTGE